MADLTFIDSGNDNILPDGLINFSKCRLIYSQIRQIMAAQVSLGLMPLDCDAPCHFSLFLYALLYSSSLFFYSY